MKQLEPIRTTVSVTRYWHNPTITTTVTSDRIRLDMSLDDFKECLKKELFGKLDKVAKQNKFWDRVKYILTGRVFTDCFMSTKTSFAEEVDVAFVKIVEGIKEESKKAV